MNITYEVKDIFTILIKKWYIILSTIVLFSILSYPIASYSNKNVRDNYNRLTNENEFNYNNSLKDTVIFYKVTTNLDEDKSDRLASTIAENIVLFVNEIIKNNNDKKYDMDIYSFKWYQAFSSNFKISCMHEIPVFMISFKDSDVDYDTFVTEFSSFVNSKMKVIIGEEFTLELIDKSIYEYSKQKFSESILATPSMISSRAKIMITSAVLGLLTSIMLILIYDFKRTSNKLLE